MVNNKLELMAEDRVRNLDFIFDKHLTFSDVLCSNILIFPNFTVSALLNLLYLTIATSVVHGPVHSKLDYYNSLYLSLPNSQLCRLQQIQNFLVRAVVNAPISQPTPLLFSNLYTGLKSINVGLLNI